MSFAFPIALTLAALSLPIIGFYILKVRLRRVAVSTNLFWKQIYEEKPPRAIWQHFRHLISLLLQLLILLLIVLAIADPYLSGQLLQARRLVIVMDNSASMRASDVSPSRLAAAKKTARGIIDGLRFHDEVAIVLAGQNPDVIVGMTGHASTLKDAIDGIPLTDNPTSLAAAIDLSQQLLGHYPRGEIIVLTDGAVDSREVATVLLKDKSDSHSPGPAGPVRPVNQQKSDNSQQAARPFNSASEQSPVRFRLFSTDAGNVGITQFQVRRSFNDSLGYEILVSVKNASAASLSCRLELSLNEIPVEVIPLNLKPEEVWSRSIEKTSMEGGQLHAALTQFRAGDAELADEFSGGTSAEFDRLATDNHAWALLPERRIQSVLLVTPGNLFLQKVFEANPLVQITVRKDFPETWPADSVIVLHKLVPATLPPGNVFVVDPAGDCDQWTQGAVTSDPIVTEQDSASPLMSHLRLDNVVIPDVKPLDFRTPPHSLASSLSGDVIYAEIKRPNGKCLALSVDLDRSDLAFRTVFPIMAANALGWFAGTMGELQPSLPTGTVTTLPLRNVPGDFVGEVILQSPAIEIRRIPMATPLPPSVALEGIPDQSASDEAVVTIGPLNEAGVWLLTPSSSGKADGETVNAESQGQILAEVAVNLASERETDLRPLQQLQDVPQSTTLSTGWFSRPFWYYLTALACVVTSVEWFLYQRRLIQ